MSSMSILTEKIEKEMIKLEQLKHQKRAQEKREQEHKRKVDMRRNIIVGELFSKHFPDVLILTPRRTTSENSAEFAPLDDFLSALAADKDWGVLLRTEVNQHVNSTPPFKGNR